MHSNNMYATLYQNYYSRINLYFVHVSKLLSFYKFIYLFIIHAVQSVRSKQKRTAPGLELNREDRMQTMEPYTRS